MSSKSFRNRPATAQAHEPAEPAPGSIALDQLRAMRLQAQCLAPRLPRERLVDAVKALCGVNAQLSSAMALALRARVEGLTLDDLNASRERDRSTVRTWCMRGTMHLLASDDVDWLLSAIPPAAVREGWRWLERRAGLDAAHAALVLDEAYRVLARNGPLTRPELMTVLARRFGAQVKVVAAGVVWLNGMLGRVAFGPDRGTRPTYVALDAWLGREVSLHAEPDYAALAARYLLGYGPAQPRDMAAWWGMPLTQARTAFEQQVELTYLHLDGTPLAHLPQPSPSPTPSPTPSPSALAALALVEGWRTTPFVRLLPAFDTYLLGYHSRDFAVPPKWRKEVFHGGEVAPVILVNGSVRGTWRYERSGRQVNIRARPFSSFSAAVRELIGAEVADIGRFWGLPTKLAFQKM